MAIKKDALKKLLEFAKIPAETITKIIDGADEMDLDLPPGVHVMTDDELTTRDGVKLKDGKGEGEKAAKTAFVSELAKKMNITLKGERMGDIVTELQTLMNADADTKSKTLVDQVAALTKDKENLTTQITQAQTEAKSAAFNTQLIGLFTPNSTLGLSNEDRLLIVQKDLEFTEGGVKNKSTGEVYKNPTTHAPLPMNEALKEYEKGRKWDVTAPDNGGGRGGGNSDQGGGAGKGYTKLSEATKAWKESNPGGNEISPEFQTFIQGIAKDTPNFNYYE